MRAPGDILLLSTYELGHQPLHLASPLGFLERAGYRPRALDLAVEPLDEQAVRRARFIGISVPMHTALRLGAVVGARVKAINPAARLCYYGLYAPLNREHLYAHGADWVLGGEYEAALVDRVAQAERAMVEPIETMVEPLPAKVEPIAPMVEPLPAPSEIVLDRLDFAAPARARLPLLDRYAHLIGDDGPRPAGYTEASRGCLHHCRHCPIPSVYHGRFFVVPLAIVLADVAQQVAAGATHITLGDPDFLNGPKHAMNVARAIHAAHPTLTFDVTIKIEHVLAHRELFVELRQLGCAFVVSAVESLSAEVLRVLDKGHTRDDVDEALAILDDAHLPLRPTFVPFTPWTTLSDYLELLDWIAARGLVEQVDPIQLAIRLLIPPGSKLLELPETRALIGPLEPEKLSYAWRHPDPRMERLAHDVYVAVAAGARFADARALAHAAADRPPPAAPVEHGRVRGRAPHLSEAWFC